jgi:hypothetical protein
MQNWSNIFAETLAEYESNYVPGDQGDAGKGQVLVRAGERIHRLYDGDVGYIAKTPGQTQFHGVSVDALLDRSDSTGADFLTDELQPDGRCLIKVAYTPYAPPPPGSPLPPPGWVQPTAAYLDYPGPMVLKGDVPEPGPEPEPVPETDVLQELADIKATLALMQEQQASDTDALLLKSDQNTQAIQQQIHDLVEDVETSLKKLGIGLWLRRRPAPPE